MRDSSALRIEWTFGFSKDLSGCVQNLSNEQRQAITFLASHSAVIYDYKERTQIILQVYNIVYSFGFHGLKCNRVIRTSYHAVP